MQIEKKKGSSSLALQQLEISWRKKKKSKPTSSKITSETEGKQEGQAQF